MIKILFVLLALLSTGIAFSQSNLPACQGTNPDYWNGCIGTQKIEGSHITVSIKMAYLMESLSEKDQNFLA